MPGVARGSVASVGGDAEAEARMGSKLTRFVENHRSRLIVVALCLTHVAALAAAVVISLMLRFEGLPLTTACRHYLATHLASLLVAIPVYLAAFSGFRL